MMLIEQTTVPSTALPVQEFKDHLRLGTGFADVGAQDAALESYLRAAMAAIEGRIGKALITRDFPVEPVTLAQRRATGVATGAGRRDRVGSDCWTGTGPSLSSIRNAIGWCATCSGRRSRRRGRILPGIPTGGAVEIVFTAGFGAGWDDVPADLRQAVLLLAAQYYELRHDTVGGDAMPFGVMALIARWRTVRVLGGGAA